MQTYLIGVIVIVTVVNVCRGVTFKLTAIISNVIAEWRCFLDRNTELS